MPQSSFKSQPESAEGQVTSEDLVEVPQPYLDESSELSVSKSNEEIAREVIAGRWGRGNRRKQRLEEAGYDPAAVQEEVTKIFNR